MTRIGTVNVLVLVLWEVDAKTGLNAQSEICLRGMRMEMEEAETGLRPQCESGAKWRRQKRKFDWKGPKPPCSLGETSVRLSGRSPWARIVIQEVLWNGPACVFLSYSVIVWEQRAVLEPLVSYILCVWKSGRYGLLANTVNLKMLNAWRDAQLLK